MSEDGRAAIPREWTFESSEIARGFDRHVREQLPWYDLVTGAVTHLARHYIPEDGLVYDLGAATGNIGRALRPTLDARNAHLIALDSSSAMVGAYDGPGECHRADIATYGYEECDLVVAMLVVMFLPAVARGELVTTIRRALRPGGALILVDKLEAPSGYVGTMLHRLTLAGKVAAGVPADEIIAKELSLAGVQRPLHRQFVPTFLPDAIEFFRFGEFAGWLLEAD